MEEGSLTRIQGDREHDAKGLLGKKRAEALAKATRHQFYQSDRVKKFNSMLLLTETLKVREEQMEIKRQMEIAAEEETKKFMAEIRRQELEAVEREREKVRRREREQAANAECLMQQLKNPDLTMKLEREKEVEECQRWRERYEREKAEVRKREKEEKVSARKAHEFLVSARDAIRAREAQRHEMEEERRRLAYEEKERRARRREEEGAERRRQIQMYKQKLAYQLAAQLQEKAGRHDEQTDRAMEQADARHKSEAERKRQEKAEKTKATLKAIAAARELRCRVLEQRVQEEQRIARDVLHANQEADRAHWEGQQLKRQKKKEARGSMDGILRQQMAERLTKGQLSRSELLDFEKKNAQLLAEEEEQFQQYTAEVIEAAAKTNRNTCALRKAARQTMVCGLGPITGGMRAGYLISSSPSHARVPNYIGTTNENIKRLYASTGAQHDRRMDFIW
ncbi:coiled-coil domain-containing protein 173-like [Anguilla anguilla]|uniref:coiled-coil domain-containing protein 173-like n=1 Tax=Anguilla anguilla TaxID=7936 RepID=UPI0015A8C292|nr:coiled-coil domain-containing protein 173-like [Anguilla anguilla]